MSTHTWESHLQTRGNPDIAGTWNNTSPPTPWEFYQYDQQVPPEVALRTSMCVPVFTLSPHNPRIALTLNSKRGGWEIPGGHLDRLADGSRESAVIAASREVGEETGIQARLGRLIAYGYTEASNAPDSSFPPRTYMQYFGAYTPDEPKAIPGFITDPEVDGAGIFTWDGLRRMAERGEMKSTELVIAGLGVRAVLRQYGLSDEHISLP